MLLEMIRSVCALLFSQDVPTPGPSGLASTESLATAITMEGLLFAAFSVGYKLTEVTEEGRGVFFTQAWFGWCIVATITLVAVAASASWWEVFGSGWPANIPHFLLGIGLGLGIIAQPIFAAAINVESKRA
jgi:hypothetical protein